MNFDTLDDRQFRLFTYRFFVSTLCKLSTKVNKNMDEINGDVANFVKQI